jgi:hypothetical protein
MTLLEKINSDLISSMKAKEKDRLNVIRMLKSAVQMKKIELNHDLSAEEIIDVISKQIKMRRESIKEFVAANREDLASQYQKEIEVLNEYMPMQISLEEATKIIDEAFNKINPESNKQMGLIMKEVSPKLKGVFDMGEASKIIREKLNNL